MTMGHRERVLKALNHEEPDRVPLDLGGAAGSSLHINKYEELKAHFGVEGPTTLGNRWVQSVHLAGKGNTYGLTMWPGSSLIPLRQRLGSMLQKKVTLDTERLSERL